MKTRLIKDITEAVGQTPLYVFKRVRAPHGAEILAKMECFNPGGSLKDRACLNMIRSAEMDGRLKPGATVIEPTSGNTGIGLAMICAVKGYRCILTMPQSMSLERTYLLRHFGAEVVLTSTHKGMAGAIQKAEALARSIEGSFIPRQFENPANVAAHRTTAQEIIESMDKPADVFVTGVGTGGTLTGIGRVLKAAWPHVKIVAVEPAASPVLSGGRPGQHLIQGIGAGFIPPLLDRTLIDEIITVEDREAFDMMRRLGREEGLCVGISSGANMAAALKLARRLDPEKTVLTVMCDTGERYFSLEQYFKA